MDIDDRLGSVNKELHGHIELVFTALYHSEPNYSLTHPLALLSENNRSYKGEERG